MGSDRWHRTDEVGERHTLRTERVGIVTLDRQSGDWFLRTPRDPHGYRAVNLGSGSLRTAKARARAELKQRDDDEAERRRGWHRVR